ncbi:hypothetical protein AVEN_275054-1 [Araneus ventricosus]|uniref:Zeta-sarcoglycan n=1 Tax=Araneus ventricosus TaxID=182803 RepID=A0A4Y2NXS5_ARAVE|nr:hypothetical protein AVEN_275054-1 [Araneus ventricosus]
MDLNTTVDILRRIGGEVMSQSLKLESAGNVTMKARNSRGFITNILSLGEAGLQAIGNYFLVRGTSGNVLLQVDPHEMVVSANHMVVSDSGGLRLDGSLETPLVRGGATKDLRYECLYNILVMLCAERMKNGVPCQVSSPSYDII